MKTIDIALALTLGTALAVLSYLSWEKYVASTPKSHTARTSAGEVRGGLLDFSRITMRIVPRQSCIVGDFDLIQMVGDEQDQLLLTIESLSQKDLAPLARATILPQHLDNGHPIHLELTLEHLRKVDDLGVFICQDNASRQRCMGKPVFPYDQADVMFFGDSRATSAPRPDYMMYFQYLKKINDQLHFLEVERAEPEAVLNELLRLTRVGRSPAESNSIYQYSARHLEQIGSLSLGYLENTSGRPEFAIELPKLDRESCNPEIRYREGRQRPKGQGEKRQWKSRPKSNL